MTTTTENRPLATWTRLNIRLHWLIVGLLLLQFIDNEWMIALFDEGSAASALGFIMGYGHIVVGATIFVAAALRLWDRFAHGRPAHDGEAPEWAVQLARWSHGILYGLLIAMPIAGTIAWFTGSEFFAAAHGWGWTALLVMAGLHVLGALVNHFWFNNDVLRRMMPGHGRPVDFRQKS